MPTEKGHIEFGGFPPGIKGTGDDTIFNMGAHASPWLMKLHQRKNDLIMAIEVEDFTHIDHRKEAVQMFNFYQASKDELTLFTASGGSTETVKRLKDIAVDTVESNDVAMKIYTDEVKKTSASDKTQPAKWVQRLRERGEQAKQSVSGKIDSMTTTAINTISQLPSSQQEAASNLFEAAIDIITAAFSTLVDQIKEVIGRVWDYLKGIWAGLKAAYKTVKLAVSQAVYSLSSLFKLKLSSDQVWQAHMIEPIHDTFAEVEEELIDSFQTRPQHDLDGVVVRHLPGGFEKSQQFEFNIAELRRLFEQMREQTIAKVNQQRQELDSTLEEIVSDYYDAGNGNRDIEEGAQIQGQDSGLKTSLSAGNGYGNSGGTVTESIYRQSYTGNGIGVGGYPENNPGPVPSAGRDPYPGGVGAGAGQGTGVGAGMGQGTGVGAGAGRGTGVGAGMGQGAGVGAGGFPGPISAPFLTHGGSGPGLNQPGYPGRYARH